MYRTMDEGTSKSNIWLQLARLQGCCGVRLDSVYGQDGQLAWQATISRNDGATPPLIVEQQSAADALLLAVTLAERAGWIVCDEKN